MLLCFYVVKLWPQFSGISIREAITGKSSIEFWTKLKKSTTKWNPEAGVNWMS